jgi:DNA-binding MarR family transcriptional regulator
MSTTPNAPWIGALLRLVWQHVRDQIGASVKEAGFSDVSRAHVSLFRYPGLDGSRPTELADELQVSKQAVNDLLRDLERRGYIRREIDAADRRSRLIRLTRRGVELEHAILAAARAAEVRLESELGSAKLASLRGTLIEAAELLGAEERNA